MYVRQYLGSINLWIALGPLLTVTDAHQSILSAPICQHRVKPHKSPSRNPTHYHIGTPAVGMPAHAIPAKTKTHLSTPLPSFTFCLSRLPLPLGIAPLEPLQFPTLPEHGVPPGREGVPFIAALFLASMSHHDSSPPVKISMIIRMRKAVSMPNLVVYHLLRT